jgi:hypothetical protein
LVGVGGGGGGSGDFERGLGRVLMGKESRYQRRGGGRKLDSVGNIVVTGLTWSLSGSCARVHRLAFFYFLSFLHAFERQKISKSFMWPSTFMHHV